MIDLCVVDRDYSILLNQLFVGLSDIHCFPIEKTYSEILRPFSRSKDPEDCKDYTEIVVLLNHFFPRVVCYLIGRVSLLRCHLNRWDEAIDDEFEAEVLDLIKYTLYVIYHIP